MADERRAKSPDLIDVLLVEDNDNDAELMHDYLRRHPLSGIHFRAYRVETLAGALHALAGTRFDVVVLDLNLPDSMGLDTIRRMRAANQTTPIIVVTGDFEQDAGVRAIQAGAQDYFMKSRVDSRLLAKALLRQARKEKEARP